MTATRRSDLTERRGRSSETSPSGLRASRRFALAVAIAAAAFFGGAGALLLGVCGPFTDVTDAAFCPFVLEIFTLGITTGTTPTTYDPATTVNRLQMAAFLSRTVDGVLKRGSRRAALDQFWTTQNATVLGLTTVASSPAYPASDGADIWVPSTGGTIARVRASDGKLLETWTSSVGPFWAVIAMGRVVVSGQTNPGRLYLIDPTQVAGAVTTVATNLGVFPAGMAFDGTRFWTANNGPPAGISIVTPGASIPWTVTTVTSGFTAQAVGAVFDGTSVWVTELETPGRLLKLDSAGAILQTVTVGGAPQFPVFDGSNIWVPNSASDSVTVVRASTGAVLQTLTGNGLLGPVAGGFDGQRVLITSGISGNKVLLWKAADLTPLGAFSTGPATGPQGVCSDGVNFWLTLNVSARLARF